ncbi:O-linked N-acetylglucosamine transferase, SPINDLY family protein [Kushneria sp. Sum13]|uniref:O-linked N-acetylglucosamine transferase, SPINDLY family protein n=1 Tax=Kushneria sp. Sum13 TaxID=3459196 RepID=UPI004045B4D3
MSKRKPKHFQKSMKPASREATPEEQRQFLAFYDVNDFVQAQRYAETLTQRYPKDAFGWKVLGSCLHKNGHISTAQETLERSLELNAGDAQTQHLMARAWYDLGEPLTALQFAGKAVTLEPAFAQGHYTLAEILTESDQDEEALDHVLKAEALGYNTSACLFMQSHIYTKRRRYQLALDTVSTLLEREPDNPFVQNEIGNLYKDLGHFDKAETAYRKALSLQPDFDTAFSNLLICMHYNPDVSADHIFSTIRNWESHFNQQVTAFTHQPVLADAGKTIRIGLVSPGFRMHPVGQMILTGLENIQPGFELHFYSTNNADDALTQRLKQVATRWNLVRHLDQTALADRIHQDNIDILIDLSGFGEGSRLRTMSRKPAPLIVKWVGGLINTMGLPCFDYLISDHYETPEGCDHSYSEKLIRMPNDYICYLPAPNAPAIKALPAMSNGYITLGCFNNPAKINPELLGEWARLMHELPNSRLFLKSGQYESTEYCERIRRIMSDHGIETERLTLEGPSNNKDLLEAYNRVDIALDTWPYSGGLTTCEAFMMGVPVVTLPGPTFAGRHSASHLINAGMPELVVNSWEEYRQRVVELASDIPNLSVIRACLRQFLIQSPTCDAEQFGQHFSTAMRAIWQRYCDGKDAAVLTLNAEDQVFFEDQLFEVTPYQSTQSSISFQDNFFENNVQTLPSAKDEKISPAANTVNIPDQPHMSESELTLFDHYLSRSKKYFEFGSGGSTVIAAGHGLTIHGVESDQQWVAALKEKLGAPCQVTWCDIGPTGAWGVPVNRDMRESFPAFSQSILNQQENYDFVLVDGRFRVACTLAAIKKSMLQDTAIIIFIHDFWNRSQYHVVLLFLEHLESSETAGVFKPRDNIDMDMLERMYQQYAHNPD